MSDLAAFAPIDFDNPLSARVHATAILKLSLDKILGAGEATAADLLEALEPEVAPEALLMLTFLLDQTLRAHTPGCAASSPTEIIAVVREHVCGHCAPRRDLAVALRAVQRGGFYLETLAADPVHYAHMVGLALAASLMLSEPAPYDTVGQLEVLLVEAFEAHDEELSA